MTSVDCGSCFQGLSNLRISCLLRSEEGSKKMTYLHLYARVLTTITRRIFKERNMFSTVGVWSLTTKLSLLCMILCQLVQMLLLSISYWMRISRPRSTTTTVLVPSRLEDWETLLKIDFKNCSLLTMLFHFLNPVFRLVQIINWWPMQRTRKVLRYIPSMSSTLRLWNH